MNILEIDFREEQISRIIDVIVSYRINGSEAYEKNKEFWKELVYYLEEIKINSCNKKYFDMTKIVKIINENKDVSESILDYLVEKDTYLAQIGDLNIRYVGVIEDTLIGKRQVFHIVRKIKEE